jgi:hypothetical protein
LKIRVLPAVVKKDRTNPMSSDHRIGKRMEKLNVLTDSAVQQSGGNFWFITI